MYSTLKILNHLHGCVHRCVFLFVRWFVSRILQNTSAFSVNVVLDGKNIRCTEVADTKRGLLGLGVGMRSAECCSCLNQYLPKRSTPPFLHRKIFFYFL